MLGTSGEAAERFDGERALKSIEAQCGFGPRIPGTAAHERTRLWIKAELEAVGRVVWEQPFAARLALTGASIQGWNLWGLPAGWDAQDPDLREGPPLILLSGHWDTRPSADNELFESRRLPFPGANDGGSGVAVILELARAVRDESWADRVVLAFWDAEDSGVAGDEASWCLGSRHAANHPPAWLSRLHLGVNLDMVGGKGLRLSRELHSLRSQPGPVGRLWTLGRRHAPSIFSRETIGPMLDDHVPFLQAGFPYIDLIGLPYPYWHRLGDAPDQCDAEVMAQLGEVLIRFIPEELKLADALVKGSSPAVGRGAAPFDP